MNQKRIVKVKGEGFLLGGAITFVMLSVLMQFVFSASVQTSNSELQRLKTKIDSQEKMNLSMEMEINELSSLDNALNVAGLFGLEYNNNNIKVIDGE